MKNTFIIFGAMALCALPAFANDNMADGKMTDHWMKKIDTNGDGYISKEEHQAFADKMFAEADTNRDGKLSKDEMMAFKKKEHDEWKSNMSDRPVTSDDTKTNVGASPENEHK